jgi:hypothetical protein
MNNILPFRLGEVGRTYVLGRKAGLDFWQVLPSVIIERALDVALGAGLFLSMLPFVVGLNWAQQAATGTMVVIGLGLVVLFITARNRQAFEEKLNQLGQKVPFLGRLLGRRLSAFLDGLSILKPFYPAWVGWCSIGGWEYHSFYTFALFPRRSTAVAAFSLGALAPGKRTFYAETWVYMSWP